MAGLFILPGQFKSSAGGKQVKKGLFQQTTSHEEGIENYDIRSADKSPEISDALLKYRQSANKDAAVVADVRSDFVRGEEELKQRIPTVKFEYNEDIRIPEVITPDVWKSEITWLSAPSTTKRSEILRNFVKENNSLVGVSDEQADSLRVQADYTNPDGNLSYALLEQFIGDVPVFRGEIKAGFTKDGRIIRVINNLAPGLDYGSLSTDFRDPLEAVRSAFGSIGKEPTRLDVERNAAESTDLKVKFGNGDWATTAEKMYFPTEPGIAVPAWRVLIWQPVNAYYVIVAAEDGRMLWRKNIANDQTQSGTYNVYANSNSYLDVADSPNPFSPGPNDPTTGTLQGARVNRVNRTLIGNEGTLSFNNNGWITDGANITDGNAVEAGLDRDTTNGVDAARIPTGSPNRTFNYPINPGNPVDNSGDSPLPAGATPPCLAAPPAVNDFQNAAATQMFYVMNRYHDELYKRGFTEQARNFQASNFGRGGAEGDRVSAEGQDCSGTNNANFATPADGTRGRMQMFLWTGPTPDFDGTIDAEVIIHEVTHGLSNRLHGGSGGLTGNFAGGMGEGWSDWYSYTLLAEPTDPVNGVYTTGGYATYLIAAGFTANYYYGIRRFPRAPITFLGANGKPHNPFTFQYLNANCATLIGTTTSNPPPNSAFPRGPIGVAQCDQVHNVGEVWSSLLWEVRNRFVARLGFTAGTTRVLQIVTDGMKLAPLSPNFIQERDAIIAAAAALPAVPEATLDVQDVREGFRVRGMGFSASIQTSSPIAVTEAFDVPNALITNPISVSDSTGDNDGFPEPGEPVLVSVPITNDSGNTINNVQAQVTGGSLVSYGNIANGATVVRQLPYTVPAGAACGSLHQVTIGGQTALGALNPRNFSFRLGAPIGGAPVTFTNNTALTIPDSGVTTPYGTTINVTGLTGQKKIQLEVTGLTHTFPGDLDYLLVGPGGQKYSLLSDSGGTGDTSALTFTLSDNATVQPSTTQWVAGDFRPANIGAGDPFPAPAPAAPYLEAPAAGTSATFNSVFGGDGATMNGTWTLYLVDDAGGDLGSQAGWKLTFEANDYSCVFNPPSAVESRADFDNDGKTDLSVFRTSGSDAGFWYLQQSTAGFGAVKWGLATDTPVPGDYNGDDKADFAIYRPEANSANADFWVLNSGTFTLTGISWGLPGDIPVIQDYDNDNKDDYAVFRPSTNQWFILKSSGGVTVTAFGQSGDVPVTGDFNGDGSGDLVVYRSGTWIGQLSGGGTFNTAFGSAGDILVPADYSGDGKDDLAVFRPSNGQWIYQPSSGGAAVFTPWGSSGDVPVPGDYDGDGKDDFAIYRNGQWWVSRSTAGTLIQSFGIASDKAIPRSYIP